MPALVTAAREIGLEVSADKTKYMVMSREQNAGRNHSVRSDNSTFERVEGFCNRPFLPVQRPIQFAPVCMFYLREYLSLDCIRRTAQCRD